MHRSHPRSAAPAIPFTPIPLRVRRDGWTPGRQRAFIAALFRTGSVTRSARAAGLSVRSAYKLYDHPAAEGFRAAWGHARQAAVERRTRLAALRPLAAGSAPALSWPRELADAGRPASQPASGPISGDPPARLAAFLRRHADSPHLGELKRVLSRAFGSAPDAEKAAQRQCEFRELPAAGAGASRDGTCSPPKHSAAMRHAKLLPALALVVTLAACHSGPDNSRGNAPGDSGSTQAYGGIAAGETLRFTGTEPFWGGSVTGDKLTYSTPENPAGATIPVERFAGRNGLSFSGKLDGGDFVMAVTPGACSDGMSGRSYPFTVMLQLAGETRDGCAWSDVHPFKGSAAP